MRQHHRGRIAAAGLSLVLLATAAPAAAQGLLDRLKSVASRAAGDAQAASTRRRKVTEWKVEEELQRAGLAGVRAEYRAIPDRLVQAELQRLGERLLSQWPAPLKGYAYEFVLVDHPMVNAFAVPGGRIFVITGLVGALETEAALQAVLAHEIAHVESRHTYRSDKGVRTAEAIGGLLDVFSRTTGNRGVTEVGALATNGIGGVVLANYGRDREREADMFASVFFARANQATKGLPRRSRH